MGGDLDEVPASPLSPEPRSFSSATVPAHARRRHWSIERHRPLAGAGVRARTLATRIFLPEGDAEVLSCLVVDAVQHRRARVICPRLYRLGWLLPGIPRWLRANLAPPPATQAP